jgi:carboxyl-terminal processing protease
MRTVRTHWTGAALACALLLVGGCGGGGGGAGASGGPPADPAWTSGVFQPPATFAAYCAVPRTGTDRATGMPFADKQGSSVWENNWLRSWTNAYYLWYREMPDLNPAGSATRAYFDLLKTTATTPSGNAKDRFHFTYTTAEWQALSSSDVQLGYGVVWALLADTPPRKLYVAYTEPNSPASVAGVNVQRGASVLEIDGVDLVNANDAASVATLNAGIAPATSGETHTFRVQDAPGAAARVVSMTSAAVTSTPVQNVTTFPTATGVVGYFTFNDHMASAEAALVGAFTQLEAASVADLILDLRYNGGGFLDIASEVAYMIAGPGRTTGQTFELQAFNDKYPTINPITGRQLAPEPFLASTQGYSLGAGQMLPTLGLARVYVITGPGTCSASEAIINALRGINVRVFQIGSGTCGKPYGFYPEDNCGTTYFSIEFQGLNAQNFGDYPDGFAPANAASAASVAVPGCSVADDFTRALGDPQEGRLAATIAYRATQTCPAPTGTAGPLSLPSVDGEVVKPKWLMNRILRAAH